MKEASALRVGQYMTYQLHEQMEEWEEDMDKLLHVLPIIGTAFKKTYFDSIERKSVSQIVFADDLVVNYFAESLERAPRVTHRINLYHNEIVERINSGMFIKFDVAELGQATSTKTADIDEDTPHLFLEQHRWYDLDGDGYQEPYVVTVHEQTQKLVRISPRFATDGIIRKTGEDGLIDPNGPFVKILPEQYFTRFLFMPSIDGGFYGMGFGSLLMSSNSAINTVINQLLDAGTLSNRQSGFLGRGLKLGRGKSIQVKSGEWKPVVVSFNYLSDSLSCFSKYVSRCLKEAQADYMDEAFMLDEELESITPTQTTQLVTLKQKTIVNAKGKNRWLLYIEHPEFTDCKMVVAATPQEYLQDYKESD